MTKCNIITCFNYSLTTDSSIQGQYSVTSLIPCKTEIKKLLMRLTVIIILKFLRTIIIEIVTIRF